MRYYPTSSIIMQTTKLLPLSLLLLSALNPLTTADVYYVTLTPNATCPEGVMACMTLSQYAASQPDDVNTTIVLQPGNHSLHSALNFTSLNQLTMLPENSSYENEEESDKRVSIYCSDSGNLTINGLSEVSISRLEWHGCVGNEIRNVEKVAIEDSVFVGNGETGTCFVVVQVESFIVRRSVFRSFQGGPHFLGPFFVSSVAGVFFFVRSVAIHLSESLFEYNRARIGGVMFASRTMLLTVENSTFRYNSATLFHNLTMSELREVDTRGVSFLSLLPQVAEGTQSSIMSSSHGGILFAVNSNVLVKGSSLVGNIAQGAAGCMYFTIFCNVTIMNSTFSHNIATVGGLLDSVGGTNLTIRDSVIANNGAQVNGGILNSVSSILKIDSCLCVNNIGSIGILSIRNSTLLISGETEFSYNYGSISLVQSNAIIGGNTLFVHNFVEIPKDFRSIPSDIFYGGALNLLRSTVSLEDNVHFMFNNASSAGAIAVSASELYLSGNVFIAHNNAHNNGGGIVLSLASSFRILRGNITVHNNTAGQQGGGIYAERSLIEISDGSLNIVGNSAKLGGGLYLEGASRLNVFKEREYIISNDSFVTVNFIGNQGDAGGAIYFSDTSSSSVCSNTDIRDQSGNCFIQTLQATVDLPQQLDRFVNLQNFHFDNNTAKEAGSVLFGGLLDRCTLNVFSEIAFNSITPLSPNINGITYFHAITNVQDNDMIASKPMRVCFCQETQNGTMPDCEYIPPSANIRKGHMLSVFVVAVDQVDHPVETDILAALSSESSGFNEGQLVQHVNNSCTELTYNIASPQASIVLLLHPDGPCSDSGISQTSLNVTFLPCECSIGFERTQSDSVCECRCDSRLNDELVTCENDLILVREENVWIDYINISNQECLVLFSNCPFDYCHDQSSSLGQRVNLNITNGADTQCAFNRTGVLCGACRDGLSVSLGNSNCLKCTHYSLLLFILFAFLGVLLVVFILWCNLTIAVGTINGLIFYANVFAIHKSILIPNVNPSVYFFLSWFNLDWGITTCLYDGLTSYAKTWLQLVFPFSLMGLVLVIIVISHYSQRFANLLSNRNPVATLATLILLSYTKLLRMIISTLSIGRLHCLGGGSPTEYVWLVDGNVHFFDRWHIHLFWVAIFLLILCILYTLLLLFGQMLLKRIDNLNFALWMDTYYAPCQPKHRYWIGLVLLARVAIYVIALYNTTGDTRFTFYIAVIVCIFLLTLRALIGRIYKHWALDALEISNLCNVIILIGGSLFLREFEWNQTILVVTSIAVFILMFLGVLAYHCYEYVFKRTSVGQQGIEKFGKVYENRIKISVRKYSKKIEKNTRSSNKSTYKKPNEIFEPPNRVVYNFANLRESALYLASDYTLAEVNTDVLPAPRPVTGVDEEHRNFEPHRKLEPTVSVLAISVHDHEAAFAAQVDQSSSERLHAQVNQSFMERLSEQDDQSSQEGQ